MLGSAHVIAFTDNHVMDSRKALGLLLPPVSVVEVIESVLSVCLCVCLSVCVSARLEILTSHRHVTSQNDNLGKRPLKCPTLEARECSGVFMFKCSCENIVSPWF